MKVIYQGPQDSYGFLWRDGVKYTFERGEAQDVPADVAEYVLKDLNPEGLSLADAHDKGRQVFMGESASVKLGSGRKAKPTGGDE